MSVLIKSLLACACAAVLLAISVPHVTAQDVCAAQDKRLACSVQCCGRRSCPPSCEVDCVKSCVDACAAPAKMAAHKARMRELQIRCGNKTVK
jgi:uncharacterized lipoprotein YbaY